MDFQDIVDNGKWYDFYGAVEEQFKINDMIFLVLEDPDDGYRSYLETVEQVETNAIFYSFSLAKVQVRKSERDFQDGYFIVDQDEHVWLEFGTDHSDDWYPFFYFRYRPNKLRKLLKGD